MCVVVATLDLCAGDRMRVGLTLHTKTEVQFYSVYSVVSFIVCMREREFELARLKGGI